MMGQRRMLAEKALRILSVLKKPGELRQAHDSPCRCCRSREFAGASKSGIATFSLHYLWADWKFPTLQANDITNPKTWCQIIMRLVATRGLNRRRGHRDRTSGRVSVEGLRCSARRAGDSRPDFAFRGVA